ncbi:MAG: hypothetical protein ABI947_16985 [Chloroflexota bacterium]
MTSPESNFRNLALAEARHALEIIDQKLEAADANENTIERNATLDRLGEARDWLLAEIAALAQPNDDQR